MKVLHQNRISITILGQRVDYLLVDTIKYNLGYLQFSNINLYLDICLIKLCSINDMTSNEYFLNYYVTLE